MACGPIVFAESLFSRTRSEVGVLSYFTVQLETGTILNFTDEQKRLIQFSHFTFWRKLKLARIGEICNLARIGEN